MVDAVVELSERELSTTASTATATTARPATTAAMRLRRLRSSARAARRSCWRSYFLRASSLSRLLLLDTPCVSRRLGGGNPDPEAKCREEYRGDRQRGDG